MKRSLLLACLLLLTVLVAGCSEDENVSVIQPAELTENEAALVSLLRGNNTVKIFDYQLTEEPKDIKFQLYRLDGKDWIEENFISNSDPGKEGRIALSYEKIPEKLTVGLLSEKAQGTSDFTPLEGLSLESVAYGGNILSEAQEFNMGEEVALIVQIIDNRSDGSMNIYNVQESFKDPTLYGDQYEMVYILTVTFE